MAESTHSTLDWGAPDVKAWQVEARKKQQDMFSSLGDREWDTWDISNSMILQRKVGFAMFSLPQNIPEKNNNLTGYSTTQLNEIKRVADVILKTADTCRVIHFACIFIFGKIWKKRFIIPVFKVKKMQTKTYFVDLDCRVYANWTEYLNLNRLPKCMYCYPRDGLYQGNEGRAVVDFGTSPSCNLLKRISALGNNTAPQTILEDRYFYDQSVNLNDSERNTAWLGISDSSLHTIGGFMPPNITRAAADCNVANKALRITFSIVTTGNLSVNGLGTLNDISSVVDKANKGELTPLEVFQFSTSVLFFSNILFVADSVKGMIENTQEKFLNYHCDDLTEPQIEELFKLLEQVPGETQMDKNTNKIKNINFINDKQTFYESLVNARDDLAGHQIQFSSKEPGLVNINNALHISPQKLVNIPTADFQKILTATERVKAGDMNDSRYKKTIETVLKLNRLKLEYQRDEAIVLLEEVFNTDNLRTVKIGEVKIFENMTPSELDRLTDVMEASGKNYNPKILEIANEFAKKRNCKTLRDYCNYVEFTSKYLNNLKVQKEDDFQASLDNAKKLRKVELNQFVREYGIIGKRADYFNKQVYSDFLTNPVESFNALEQRYIELEGTVLPLNANIEPNFATDAAAVCHYFKHNKFNKIDLTPDEYFEIPMQTVNKPLYQRKEQLNQQGDRNMITFTNPSKGAVCVVFVKLEDGTQSLATVHYKKEVLNQ